MPKTLKVLAVLAMVICLIEAFANVVDLMHPAPAQEAVALFSADAMPRLLIYWLGGFGTLVVGLGLWNNVRLLGQALSIGGVYLMLLGNNGGLFGTGVIPYRLGPSILTLFILAYLLARLNWQEQVMHHQTDKG